MVTWKEVEKKYGKKLANHMKKSDFLVGITVKVKPNGEMDIPERDIELAYRDIMKENISNLEWD